MYSLPASVCRACWSTERRFEKFGIDVEKVRVDQHPDAMETVAKLGYTQAPVVVVSDGDRVVDHWSGYRETKIAELAESVAAA